MKTATQEIITLAVLEVRNLTESSYILKFQRGDISFKAGQYLRIGIPGSNEMREYSIYSSIHDEYIEILIKEVLDGKISRKLRKIRPGENIQVEGPFGFFGIEKKYLDNRRFLFVASGTGIAPFHSFIGSYPNLDYHIVHGVRHAEEGYESNFYKKERYHLCTTKDEKGTFKGRVTEFLSKNKLDTEMLVYLCGNSEMIADAIDILQAKNIPMENIYTEVYF